MSSLSIAILTGRLVADPELKHTSSGIALTRFSIAVDGTSKSVDKRADFFDIVAWRTNAEFICKYFNKGNQITIVGRPQTGSFTGKDGIKRKTFEILVNNVYFVGAPKQSQVTSDFSNGSFDEPSIPSVDYINDSIDDSDLPF